MKKTTTTVTTVTTTVVEESEQTGGALALFALDMSGSMLFKRQEAIDGFNSYLEGIKGSVPYLSVNLFNNKSLRLCHVAPTALVEPITNAIYLPQGGTALYDTIGSMIKDADDCMEKNPGVISEVIMTIFTDGQENTSTRYSLNSIKDLIKKKESQGNWTFVFVGSELDTYTQAASMGFASINTKMYNTADTGSTLRSVANDTCAYAVRTDKLDKAFFKKGDSTVIYGGSDNTLAPNP